MRPLKVYFSYTVLKASTRVLKQALTHVGMRCVSNTIRAQLRWNGDRITL